MPYASLREFITRLESAGRLVRVAAPVSPFLEMTEIQTRLLAEGGPAVLFENVIHPGNGHPGGAMPVLVNLFGTVERVAWGMDREPHELRAIGETLAFLKQPEPPGGWREALGPAAAAQDRDGDAAAHRLGGAVPGDRAARRRYRPRPSAGPDLLAGRAGAADHLAAGRHQGSGHGARGQFQPRHLPHAGDRPRHDADALAAASRRRAASPALARSKSASRCPPPP